MNIHQAQNSYTVIITGANRGIGLSLARLNAQRGHRVYALCRQTSSELSLLGVNVIEGIDVQDTHISKRLTTHLADINIDLLINNAGILRDDVLGHIEYASITEQLDVNALGPLRITEALKSQLVPGAKVAFITSRMGSIADNTSGGRYGYRMSKAALNAAGMSLAQDLKKQQIAVALLHPGLVGTDMIGGIGNITPDQAAQDLMARIDALNLTNSGSFWHANGDTLPW